MAHTSSFTINTRGNVSRWDDEAGRYPELSSRDVVGAPAALFLTACRGETGTVIASRGTAPSLHAADVESAFEFSAFEHSTAGLEVYDAGLSVLRADSAALAMRGRSANRSSSTKLVILIRVSLWLRCSEGSSWVTRRLSKKESMGATAVETRGSSQLPHFSCAMTSRPLAPAP